ncbi:MAG: cytochrome c [Magnetovibrio sp.]|nr:cytochrome c [Magnetovibrio sp.]
MTPDQKHEQRKYNPNITVKTDAPVAKSPLKWMGLVMLILAVLTTMSMWGREKISIKASPIIPELSAKATHGRELINAQCADCHGVDGTGHSTKGPPLLHPMYREEIFPDFHFKRVLREGRPQNNWRFGPMPAQPQLSDADMVDIIAFVREVHTATGVQ